MVLQLSLDIIKLQVTAGNWPGVLPLYWDPISDRVRLSSCPRQILKWKIFSYGYLTTIGTEMVYFAIVMCAGKKKESMPFLLLRAIFLFVHIAGFIQIYSNLQRCRGFSQFFESVKQAGVHQEF